MVKLRALRLILGSSALSAAGCANIDSIHFANRIGPSQDLMLIHSDAKQSIIPVRSTTSDEKSKSGFVACPPRDPPVFSAYSQGGSLGVTASSGAPSVNITGNGSEVATALTPLAAIQINEQNQSAACWDRFNGWLSADGYDRAEIRNRNTTLAAFAFQALAGVGSMASPSIDSGNKGVGNSSNSSSGSSGSSGSNGSGGSNGSDGSNNSSSSNGSAGSNNSSSSNGSAGSKVSGGSNHSGGAKKTSRSSEASEQPRLIYVAIEDTDAELTNGSVSGASGVLNRHHQTSNQQKGGIKKPLQKKAMTAATHRSDAGGRGGATSSGGSTSPSSLSVSDAIVQVYKAATSRDSELPGFCMMVVTDPKSITIEDPILRQNFITGCASYLLTSAALQITASTGPASVNSSPEAKAAAFQGAQKISDIVSQITPNVRDTYVQYTDPRQVLRLQNEIQRLRSIGFPVEKGMELVDLTVNKSVVKYFFDEDKLDAERMAAALRSDLAIDVTAKQATDTNARPGNLEIWIANHDLLQ